MWCSPFSGAVCWPTRTSSTYTAGLMRRATVARPCWGCNRQSAIYEFTDQNGNVVRTLEAGKGFALTFTNLEAPPQRIVELPSNGSVTRTTINDDGTTTFTTTGHNVLILFPTDVPPGPSTTLYVGRVVFTVDADGIFTVQSTSGKSTDICALLA
jgi:hypothetical protein